MVDLTEALCQRIIMTKIYRSGFCLPNYTPRGWWECDVFYITAAGYFREYEVKLTLGDFKADKRKGRLRWRFIDGKGGRRWEKVYVGKKHDQLKIGDTKGPSQFFYVVPQELLYVRPDSNNPYHNPDAVVPTWAGLIEIQELYGWLRPVTIKPAPRLHKEKFAEKRLEHARTIPYWRMHDLLKSWEGVRVGD